MHKHYYEYLNQNELLSSVQSGFRPKHSGQTCLTSLIDDCILEIENGLIGGLITIDMCKAFDLLDFKILLCKLKLYGCSDLTVKWF